MAATGLSFAAHTGWPMDLMGQFQAQFVLVGLCLVVLFDLLRHYRAALVALGCTSVALWQMDVIDGTRFADFTEKSGTKVRVAAVNLFGSDVALDRLADEHQRRQFDLIVLTEIPASASKALLSRFPGQTHIAGQPQQALVGRPSAVVLSRMAPQHLKLTKVNRNRSAITQARYCFQAASDCLTVFALHTPPPIREVYYLRQKAILETLADRIEKASGAVLVAGDMNGVSWAPQMVNFQRKTEVKKVVCGNRWTPTWLVPVPGMGLELDHLFIKGAIAASKCERGKGLGSDHWPLYSTLRLVNGGTNSTSH
jgi:endonuclease/exonuclease/phosphatase (EEP) superfamily protein YafD